ncbi:hypothetical protein L7A49_33005, partial [Achromobacter xylosoxidans]|nr:hypothetical protein [Achromobacter xylosoxidans]
MLDAKACRHVRLAHRERLLVEGARLLGQVLAYIEPASGVLERSGQMAQVAELRAGQALAQKRLARLRE